MTAGRLQPLSCRRPACDHGYLEHAPGAAHCRVCDCHGFQWVDLVPPAGEDPGYPRRSA